jgi:hypothetical protein
MRGDIPDAACPTSQQGSDHIAIQLNLGTCNTVPANLKPHADKRCMQVNNRALLRY